MQYKGREPERKGSGKFTGSREGEGGKGNSRWQEEGETGKNLNKIP